MLFRIIYSLKLLTPPNLIFIAFSKRHDTNTIPVSNSIILTICQRLLAVEVPEMLQIVYLSPLANFLVIYA